MRVFFFMLLIIALSFGSCVRKESHSLRDEAIALYNDSRQLTETYIDSIENAGDSATLLGIASRFEEKLAKVNFHYPANTDLEITEDENDTLSTLTTRYVFLRDSLLYRFAHPILLRPDSTQTQEDSSQTISNPSN